MPSPSSLFPIRQANSGDVSHVSYILTESFYRNSDRPINFLQRCFVDLAYPLLRYGIMLDLNSRLGDKVPCYACLVATNPVNKSQAIATLEICMRYVPVKTKRDFWSGRDMQQHPYIYNLAVHPQWRRQGVAQQLLLSAEQTVRQWGFGRLYMHVLEDNHPARSLYHRIGYRLHSHEGIVNYWLLGQPRRLLLQKRF
ncbi:GNAT family N-acetyltransferase [Pseudanabaena mucicola]|uniref:GNAT family N-acetyltransferase n=1 Tax=Pseudanabaena mucicola FACHB-723 TaxID=2692860 RepID=A0ABR8A178_9CYAN|nr:GNAT family N-acetyltransferase [Pseudanabaena mucicola]MBD2189301.1 GNAT family N-acetyltransferase [Pseudanabaena mucicola FACHB-723]